LNIRIVLVFTRLYNTVSILTSLTRSGEEQHGGGSKVAGTLVSYRITTRNHNPQDHVLKSNKAPHYVTHPSEGTNSTGQWIRQFQQLPSE